MDPATSANIIITMLQNIIVMHLFSVNCLTPNIHFPWDIEVSRPRSAILHHNMDSWMSPKSSRVSHQPSPKPLLVFYLVSATTVPVIMRKLAHVNPIGQQHNDAWDTSTKYNKLFPVSANIYSCDQGHFTIFPVKF